MSGARFVIILSHIMGRSTEIKRLRSKKPLKLKLEEFSLDLKLRNIDSLILDSRNQELINVDL